MINSVDYLMDSLNDLFGFGANPMGITDGSENELRYSVPSFPPANIYIKEDGSINFKFALAGYSKDDLKISLDEDTNSLLLKTSDDFDKKKDDDKENTKTKWLVEKLKTPKFSYTYTLPSQKFDFDSADAKFEDGILTISVKKLEKPKKDENKYIRIK